MLSLSMPRDLVNQGQNSEGIHLSLTQTTATREWQLQRVSFGLVTDRSWPDCRPMRTRSVHRPSRPEAVLRVRSLLRGLIRQREHCADPVPP
jgi:hypothetical protein